MPVINCCRTSKSLKGIYFFFEFRKWSFFQESQCFFFMFTCVHYSFPCFGTFDWLYLNKFNCLWFEMSKNNFRHRQGGHLVSFRYWYLKVTIWYLFLRKYLFSDVNGKAQGNQDSREWLLLGKTCGRRRRVCGMSVGQKTNQYQQWAISTDATRKLRYP